MPTELVVDVIVKRNCLCIDVIQQPDSITRGSGIVYKEAEGWTISTGNRPAVDVPSNELWVRGRQDDRDALPSEWSQAGPDHAAACAVADEIKAAIREYNNRNRLPQTAVSQLVAERAQ